MGEAQEVGKVVVFYSGHYEQSEKRHLLEGGIERGKYRIAGFSYWVQD